MLNGKSPASYDEIDHFGCPKWNVCSYIFVFPAKVKETEKLIGFFPRSKVKTVVLLNVSG